MLKCKITKLATTIWPLIRADIVVAIYGHTGIGKSFVIGHELMKMCEAEYGECVFHDIRLSTKDIVDGTGMPIIDKDEKATFWTRPAFIPKDDGKMHIFFFDEFGHAAVQLQQMFYSIAHDRALGGYPLPARHRIIMATNTRPDGGGDNKMLKPLENRVAHVTAEVDAPGLIEKLKQWGWDSRLIAFLSVRPGEIHNVSQTDAAFPTPRSLEMFTKVLKELPLDTKQGVLEEMAQACCGDGFARQFMTFITSLGANLPKMAEILADPQRAKLPSDTHFQYVVASYIAVNVNNSNSSKLAEYLLRLAPDVRSMAAHAAITRDETLRTNKDIRGLILDTK